MLAVRAVLLVLATGWTVPHLFEANMASDRILAALDTAWPLSMPAHRPGRHGGPIRPLARKLGWAPIASLRFPVAILAHGAGEWPGLVVSSLWLVATDVPSGVLLVRHADIVDATTASSGLRVEVGPGALTRQR